MIGCSEQSQAPDDGGQSQDGLTNFHMVMSCTGLTYCNV